jgi:hypothetical protein
MRSLTLIFSVLAAFSTSSILAQTAQPIILKSQEQIEINLTYSTATENPNSSGGQTKRVNFLRIDLYNGIAQDLESDGQAVILTKCVLSATGASYEFPAWIVDLKPRATPGSSAVFLSGKIEYAALDQQPIVSTSSMRYPSYCRNEIAVVINGQWLVDPINGTHNFQVNFAD